MTQKRYVKRMRLIVEMEESWLFSFLLRFQRVLSLVCIFVAFFYATKIFPTQPEKLYLSVLTVYCITFMFQTGYYVILAVNPGDGNQERLQRYTLYWLLFSVLNTVTLIHGNEYHIAEMCFFAGIIMSINSLCLISYEDHERDYIFSELYYDFCLTQRGKLRWYLAYNFLPYLLGVPSVLYIGHFFGQLLATKLSIGIITLLTVFVITDEFCRHRLRKSYFWCEPNNFND